MSDDDLPSDEELIQKVLRGEAQAFGGLVLRHQVRLFNSILHHSGSREEAEDVLQEAFFQAYGKLGSFRGQSAFFTWLYRIAFNLAITRQRRRRAAHQAEQRHEENREEPAGDVDPSEAPDERLAREERAVRLHGALARLEEDFRAILVLRDIDGRSYEEIAEILELPPGTVRSRLHRARLQLREQLAGFWGETESTEAEAAETRSDEGRAITTPAGRRAREAVPSEDRGFERRKRSGPGR